MPTLMQKIQQGNTRRDQSGQLTNETPEELQTLSGKMGLQSSPITPLGAQTIGANPDQAKMAGTPSQKNASLAASVQPGQSLQDTLRRNQGNQTTQANVGQQASQQKSEELKNLGGIGDRVQGFIEAQRQKLAAATQAAQTPEVQAAQTFNGKDVSQIKPLLAQLRANPSDQNLMLQVNQALGYDAKTQLDPSQINQLYESSVDAIARAGAGNVDSDLTVKDLVSMGDFGYDEAELSHLLGIPQEQVGAMNVAQIRDRVAQIQQQEYSGTQQLEQQSQSGNVGAAERALAREGAREASRVGTRSSEADIAHLQDQIAKGDQVQFGGKQYSVEDLLQDDTISGIIGDYLNSAPGSPERTQLEQTEPALAQFVQKNQTLLDEASKNLQSGAQTFQQTQAYNQQLAAGLPENLAKLLVPEAGSLSATKIDPNTRPLLKYIQQDPGAAQLIQGVDDHDAQALTSLNENQLGQLFGNGGQGWKNYQETRTRTDQMRKAVDTAPGPDAMTSAAFGGSVPGYSSLKDNFNKQKEASSLGLPDSAGDYKSVTDSSGNLLDADGIRKRFDDQVGSYSLQDSLAGKQPGGTFQAPQDASNSWNSDQKKLYDGLADAASDGHIDSSELVRSPLTVADILGIANVRAPAFGSPSDFSKGIAEKTTQEVGKKYDLNSLQGLIQAQAEMDKVRTQLVDKLRDTGNASSAIDAFGSGMSDLSRRIDAAKQTAQSPNQEAMKKAQDDWDKKYQGVYKDEYGHWVKKVGDRLSPVSLAATSIPERPK